jgi:hypothetical protein
VDSDAPSCTQRCLTGNASLPSLSEEQISSGDDSIVAFRPRHQSPGLTGLYSLTCVSDIMYLRRQSLGPVHTLSPSSFTLVTWLKMKEIQWAYNICRATVNPSKITSSISTKMKSTCWRTGPSWRSHYWRLVIDSALPIRGNNVFRSAWWTTFASRVSMSGVRYSHLPVNDSTKSPVPRRMGTAHWANYAKVVHDPRRKYYVGMSYGHTFLFPNPSIQLCQQYGVEKEYTGIPETWTWCTP